MIVELGLFLPKNQPLSREFVSLTLRVPSPETDTYEVFEGCNGTADYLFDRGCYGWFKTGVDRQVTMYERSYSSKD